MEAAARITALDNSGSLGSKQLNQDQTLGPFFKLKPNL